MHTAIFLVYSTSGINFGKKVSRELKMAAILKILNIKHSFNLTSDMIRYGDDVIDDVTGWLQSFSLYP